MPEEKTDVQEVSSTPEEKVEGQEPNTEPSNDKDQNFANLRAEKERLEKELAEARAQSQQNDRSLSVEPEETPSEKPQDNNVDTLKVIFERDAKEATRMWNRKNEVTAEEWQTIKSKVALRGDETQSEIYDKIDEAYHSLPSTREKREKELIEKGKQEAMRQFSDEELDVSTGGDADYSGTPQPRYNQKTKAWAKGLGLSDEELSKVDTDGDPSAWTEGPQAKRAFFEG